MKKVRVTAHSPAQPNKADLAAAAAMQAAADAAHAAAQLAETASTAVQHARDNASAAAHRATTKAQAAAHKAQERAHKAAMKAIPGTELKARWEQIALATFIVLPLLAVAAAVPVAWGWGIGVRDVALALAFYAVSGHGITVGFHRYFTHGAFKAKRPLRIALAIAGSLAIEGPVTRWVADHRRHHAFSDKEGDPHSPWRYGRSFSALSKGLAYAHLGWMFDVEQTNQERFAPDLLADKDIQRVNKAFPWLVVISLVTPALLGGLLSWSMTGAVTAFFWASLVRVALLHHVTWSINSICHAVGQRPFKSRDESRNVWWLAIPSMGESWHNLHHADPTAARHGVDRGQLDTSARVIWAFEKAGWARDVRWASSERLATKRAAQPAA